MEQKDHTAKVTCHVLTHCLPKEIRSNGADTGKKKGILAPQTESGSFGSYLSEILKTLRFMGCVEATLQLRH